MIVEKKAEKQFTVITWASQGLGKVIAIALSKRKVNIILVSFRKELLRFYLMKWPSNTP
jgi:short-subunit dehydrogenase